MSGYCHITRYSDVCPYTGYYDPRVTTHYHNEWWRMHTELKSQQNMVDDMLVQLRSERRKRLDLANTKCNDLRVRVDSDARRIDSLETDLSSWRTRFDNMNDNMSTMKYDLERKDISMEQMKQDLSQCTATVEEIVAKSRSAQFEYNKLADELRMKKMKMEIDERSKKEKERREAEERRLKDAEENLYRMRCWSRFRPALRYRSLYDLSDPNVNVTVRYY